MKSSPSSKFTFGFTLIEIIVAIFIFCIITIAMIALFSNIFTVSNKQNSLLANQDSARKLMAQLVQQLRNAEPGNDGSYQLQSAGDQQIVFFANVDSQSDIERVRYYLQNGKLLEGVIKPVNNVYNLGLEQTTTIQSSVANSSSTPLFYYYDGNYAGSSTQASLSQPVNVTQVKFVKINLQIYNTGGLNGTNYFTVTGGAAIRSIKSNLGQ